MNPVGLSLSPGSCRERQGRLALQEGDVFAAEPRLYGPDLSPGIRLEQNYLVTATGVRCLTAFPLDP